MSLPPPPSDYTLPSTFTYDNWTIKYALLSPTPKPTKNLVFIHGTPWSSVVFQPLAQALLSTNDNIQMLLYDLPGYGQSQQRSGAEDKASGGKDSGNKFAGDTSVQAQAEALVSLLAHLDLHEDLHVLAHDIAGSIALRAHLLHHIPFASLMLLDTNAVLPWGDGFYKLARQNHSVFLQMPGHVHEAVVRAVVRSGSGASVGMSKGWEEILVSSWAGSAEKQESWVRQIAQADDRDVVEMAGVEGGGEAVGMGGRTMYGDVECSVRVLWGSEDTWIPREKMELLCELLGSRVEKFVVVDGAGHLLMLDRPERVEEEVREWLGV